MQQQFSDTVGKNDNLTSPDRTDVGQDLSCMSVMSIHPNEETRWMMTHDGHTMPTETTTRQLEANV